MTILIITVLLSGVFVYAGIIALTSLIDVLFGDVNIKTISKLLMYVGIMLITFFTATVFIPNEIINNDSFEIVNQGQIVDNPNKVSTRKNVTSLFIKDGEEIAHIELGPNSNIEYKETTGELMYTQSTNKFGFNKYLIQIPAEIASK